MQKQKKEASLKPAPQIEVVNSTQLKQKNEAMSPEFLIAKAIEQGASVETMEKLLAMRKELKNEWAKEQYNKAMAELQAELPIIKKEKAGGKTLSGAVAYYYAPLDAIVAQVKDIIAKNGFSYSIKTETGENKVKVYCIATHKAGHSEISDIEVPFGTKTNIMSAPQQVAAALTFAKRYAFCNSFGILTGDEDNDAAKTEIEVKKSEKQDFFEKIKTVILTAKDKNMIFGILEKLEKSELYSEKQKITLKDLINQKIDELDNEN